MGIYFRCLLPYNKVENDRAACLLRGREGV